ncbi:hypothetical protein LIER_38996 [Lithospermum erythrorhizon]|uniref:Uncharacterized protein n=1 Tax=Lithospermum erythrorhizon TaxID=34254 RepID=A0AAV3QC58_LITER
MTIVTEANENNHNNPQGIDGLNPDEVLEDASESVNLRTGGTMPKVGSSQPPEISGIIDGMKGTIVDSVMQRLWEQIPQLRRESAME